MGIHKLKKEGQPQKTTELSFFKNFGLLSLPSSDLGPGERRQSSVFFGIATAAAEDLGARRYACLPVSACCAHSEAGSPPDPQREGTCAEKDRFPSQEHPWRLISSPSSSAERGGCPVANLPLLKGETG